MGRISDFIKRMFNKGNKMLPEGGKISEVDSKIINLIEKMYNDREFLEQFNKFCEAKMPQASKNDMKEALKSGNFKRKELEMLYNNENAKRVIKSIEKIYDHRDDVQYGIKCYEYLVWDSKHQSIAQKYQEKAEERLNNRKEQISQKHNEKVKMCMNLNDYETEINGQISVEEGLVEFVNENRALDSDKIHEETFNPNQATEKFKAEHDDWKSRRMNEIERLQNVQNNYYKEANEIFGNMYQRNVNKIRSTDNFKKRIFVPEGELENKGRNTSKSNDDKSISGYEDPER